jgi:hypothetical protein
VRFIKGFGKNYFTFAAMTAYSAAKKLGDTFYRCNSFDDEQNLYEDTDDKSPPDIPLEQAIACVFQAKPCYCNKVFARKTHLAIHLHVFIPRCPYYNKYFAFRRSGSHPPKTLLI